MRLLNKTPKKAVVVVAVIMVVFFGVGSSVSAVLDSQKRNLVKANCLQSQVVIQQIQYNDAATRVNRGQAYESLLADYITPLNSRAAADGFNDAASKLTDITKQYQASLTNFKNNYEVYDNYITDTLRTKCADNPDEFYDNLEKTRLQRVIIGNEVKQLTKLTQKYKIATAQLGKEAR